MPLEVYDFRKDTKHNLITTSEVRARFELLPPGKYARHSHPVSRETWVILQGRIQFEIEGETAILEPGMMLTAAPGEIHQVTVLGEEPVIQFLTVTPHVTPGGSGQREYPETGNTYARHMVDRDLEPAKNEPTLIHNHGEELRKLKTDVNEFTKKYDELEQHLLDAQATSNFAGATDIFDTLLPLFSENVAQFYKMVDTWNTMTATLGELKTQKDKEQGKV